MVKHRASDFDRETESDGELNIDIKEKVKRLIAESKKCSTTTRKAESEDHVLQRLVSQGNNLNVDHIPHLSVVIPIEIECLRCNTQPSR